MAVENSKIVNVRRNQDESPFESPEKQARYETEAVIAYQVIIFFQNMCIIRVRPRFFDQVGHETMYASSGNTHFFTK